MIWKYIPRPGMMEAYKHVINTAYKARTKGQREDVKIISAQIDEAYNDIVKGRKLLLKEEIDAKDFREIRTESEKKIQTLEARLIDISKTTSNIEPFLDKALAALSRLD